MTDLPEAALQALMSLEAALQALRLVRRLELLLPWGGRQDWRCR
jgi:hypothetical protein